MFLPGFERFTNITLLFGSLIFLVWQLNAANAFDPLKYYDIAAWSVSVTICASQPFTFSLWQHSSVYHQAYNPTQTANTATFITDSLESCSHLAWHTWWWPWCLHPCVLIPAARPPGSADPSSADSSVPQASEWL